MNEMMREFIKQAELHMNISTMKDEAALQKYTELVVAQCIDCIETYRIPCGNSPAGELAADWTYDALESIRDEIKEKFGIQP